ncbi:MAG: hypothetical protein QNJ85_12860 [Gammaproteobacteria bacterium]|nr:hypothetical protein [Gammaproteobacteria bacterium]
MSTRKSKCRCAALGAVALLAWPAVAPAYMGPTLGLGIIGTIIALVVVLLLSLFSFVVMPLRRWRDRNRRADPADRDDTESPARESKPADGG